MIEIKKQRQGEVLVLALEGELMGGDEAKDFQDLIFKLIQEGEVNVVVNMEGVKWMNSSGLGMLMAAMTTLRSSGGDLRLAHVSDRVRRPIEVTKLDRVLRILGSTDEAVQSYASGE